MILPRMLALLAALVGPALPPVLAQDTPREAVSGTGAVMRALDKVSGQTMDAEIPIAGRAEMFGLVVELADCRYPPQNVAGDAFAYVILREAVDLPAIFAGWMIASSPALNALDHARYDVWVLRCKTS